MSENVDTKRKVTLELIKQEDVPAEKRRQCLQTAIFDVSDEKAFFGSVLQCLNIMYTHQIPTAGVVYNPDAKRWDMLINPHFFCVKMSQENRKAVLIHELLHIIHKHPLRVPFMKLATHKRMLMNIAADMAINQFIKGLPNGCPQCPKAPTAQEPCPNELCPGKGIDVNQYSDTDDKGVKATWPQNKPMEFYYEKLLTLFDDPNEDTPSDESGDGTDGEGKDGEGGDGEGKSNGNMGGGARYKGLPNTLDAHDWGGSQEETDVLDATEDLIKRAMIKQRLSYDSLPSFVRELLDEIEARKSELNYRALILSAIKRNASGHDRNHTWSRRSKRFGNYAPGTKVGDLPKLNFYIDTSGSISVEEANDFLEIVDNFLKAGSRKCRLNLFHTDNYYSEEYKLGKRLDRANVQNGGTDLTKSLEDIAQRRPDLAIFLTDGCYSDVKVESMISTADKFPQCLFIISKGGSKEHPLKRLGDTIQIPESGGAKK